MKNATKWIVIILCLSCIISCQRDLSAEIPLEELHHATTDASEIFFKNLRKPSYQLEEMKEAGIDIYRTNDHQLDSVHIQPYLALNWRLDQAYILLDLHEQVEEVSIITIGQTKQERTYGLRAPRDQTKFSVAIYNAIVRGDSILISNQNSELAPFFKKKDHREQFRVTCYDFLRLVGLQ